MKKTHTFAWYALRSLNKLAATAMGVAFATTIALLTASDFWRESAPLKASVVGILILLFFLASFWIAGSNLLREVGRLREPIVREDKNGLAGEYLKQGKSKAIVTFTPASGPDGWYLTDGGDWKGAGVLDGDRYYGLFRYNASAQNQGQWGVHFARFNPNADKPFVFVQHDLHAELTDEHLDALVKQCASHNWALDCGAFYWTRSR